MRLIWHPTRHDPAGRVHVLSRAGVIAIVAACTVLIVAGLVGEAPAAHAAGPPTTPNLQLAGNVQQVFTNIRNWLMGILSGLATVFLTLGGLRYLIGAGEPEEIHKAKTAFKAAGIGFGLAALAPLVVDILQSLVA